MWSCIAVFQTKAMIHFELCVCNDVMKGVCVMFNCKTCQLFNEKWLHPGISATQWVSF